MMDFPALVDYLRPLVAGKRALELGGGPEHPWIRPNVDVRPGPCVDFVADFERPLPFANEAVEVVFSKYAAEHVSWRTVDGWFAETHRILRPGGVLVLVVPNHLEQCRLAVELGDAGAWRWDGGVACRHFGDLDYAENSHRSAWSPSDIAMALRGFVWQADPAPSKDGKFVQAWAGYASVCVMPFGEIGTDMVVEARKGV